MENSVQEIESILFGVYSPEEIIKNSVVQITSNKLGGDNSVYDERMGILDKDGTCPSCRKTALWCSGHFGHIELNHHVFHPMYYRMIISFLKCFCIKCYKFLLTDEHLKLDNILKYTREHRFNKILEKVEKIDLCYHCQNPKPKVVFVNTENNIYYVYKKNKVLVTEDDVSKIFENINDDDIVLLGFDPSCIHPKNLILSVIPVLPTISRPYIITEGVTCDDDLTVQYTEIVKANNHLKDTDLTEAKMQKYIQTLKFRIKTLMNNSQSKARLTNGRAIKAIKERISGKEGIIRGNLMGKRCDFTSRTVIGPEPTCRLDELIVPKDISTTLTIPETVNKYNIEQLTQIVNNNQAKFIKRGGKDKRLIIEYAKYKKPTKLNKGSIIVRNGKEIIVENPEKFHLQKGDKLKKGTKLEQVQLAEQNFINLKLGDVVERHLRDGDVVFLNRQPTLWKGSMLKKTVKLMDCKTFRFCLASTKTFNADFDGDEMNIHVPQNLEAKIELEELSSLSKNLINPQASKTNVSIVMDTLLGCYLMTKKDEKIEESTFFNLCMRGENEDNTDWSSTFILKKIQHIRRVLKELGKKPSAYTGKGLMSMILPDDFKFENKKFGLKIYKGVIYEGALDKGVFGGHNSIIQCLFKEYGYKIASKFVDNIQFLAVSWITYYGFSIGISDCLQKKKELINEVIYKGLIEAKSISESNQHPKIIEAKITSTLNKTKDIGLKIAKDAMDDDNGFTNTVMSGSKGDFFNIAQITGLVGQQNLSGGRIQPVLNKGRRTLPYYHFDGLGLEKEFESRGFIANSFMKGLNPREFFFHAMSGREGVSDTAMKTANSGYIQRKMVKIMEDLQVKYDGTVRNSVGNIVQWSYGGDGYDRSNTIIKNETAEVCDISRLAEKLNTQFEMKKI